VKPLLFAFLAGLLSALAFQPFALWPLMLVALVALMRLIEKAPHLRSALARGWWFGLGNFVLGLNWIATAFTYQSNMPAWLGWVAVVLLSLYLAIYPAMATGLAWRYGRAHRLLLILWLAAGWIASEWLRATMFTGFAWNPIGVILLSTPISWFAVLIGTYGLSGITILIAGVLMLLAVRSWRAAGTVAGGLVIVAAVLALAASRAPPAAGPPLRIVQPNIGQDEKWRADAGERNFQLLVSMSEIRGPQPKLLLWPEAAITWPLQDARTDPYFQERAQRLRETVGRLLQPGELLVTGGITVASKDGLDASSATNSVFAMTPSGRILARYDKTHLVPYGEYLPARPLLSVIGLSRLAPGDIDFLPGPGPRTLALPGVWKSGFQLCYEIIFSGEVVDRRDRPAFLFNPSSDAWFGRWGPPQHLAQARLRALEEGLPVLRATPTGISAVIDSDGRLVASLPWHRRGVIDASLPGPRPPTPFARFGNLLPLLFALLLAGAAIAVRRKAL